MEDVDVRSLQTLASGVWADRERATRHLFEQGQAAVATLVAGSSHRRPQVRAACISLMDHFADERCCDAIERCLRDTSPLVRRHAVHAVGCQRCKPRPLPMDVVGSLIERVMEDPSDRVRRVAVHQLGLQPYDPRAVNSLVRVISESADDGLVARARHALREQERQSGERGPADVR